MASLACGLILPPPDRTVAAVAYAERTALLVGRRPRDASTRMRGARIMEQLGLGPIDRQEISP
ncbi:hypothetical protein GIY56_15705 [Paracoccus sp. YIM 132242]|uniref:Uncharacterized protein n=1 Tax=Paracoccus lichenicola TaxID=2665644 RepID=A0A6L6HUL3_9RHOB|nr:hypothetical protein [Paracoccus lichenicola]MTE01735.1 hypothetical protein [Paracoccus lichenicola]